MRLAVVLALASLLPACAAAPDSPGASDEGDGAETAAIAAIDTVKVAQVNICESGVWQDCVSDRTMNFGTQESLAKRMGGPSLEGVSVIGVQEITPAYAAMLRDRLQAHTGHPWGVHAKDMGLNGVGSGIAIFWRTDVNDYLEDFGTRTVEELEYPDPNHPHYFLRFTGALFHKKGTARDFGFFTGKTAWGAIAASTHQPVDNFRRGVEANRVRYWVRDTMAAHPHASRILTIDTTDEPSPAWLALTKDFDDGNPTYFTHPAFGPKSRYDQIFWDFDASATKHDSGFVDGPRCASPFGSDHRFTWATVALSPPT